MKGHLTTCRFHGRIKGEGRSPRVCQQQEELHDSTFAKIRERAQRWMRAHKITKMKYWWSSRWVKQFQAYRLAASPVVCGRCYYPCKAWFRVQSVEILSFRVTGRVFLDATTGFPDKESWALTARAAINQVAGMTVEMFFDLNRTIWTVNRLVIG